MPMSTYFLSLMFYNFYQFVRMARFMCPAGMAHLTSSDSLFLYFSPGGTLLLECYVTILISGHVN